MDLAPNPVLNWTDHGIGADSIEVRVVRQRDALLTLAAAPFGDCETVSSSLARIAEVAASTLSVSRVSIWKYNDARTAITCLHIFDQHHPGAEAGTSLAAADFPHYFRVMAESDVVAVEDAMADPRTSEFTTPYLRPLGIVSMMDVPIHASGEVIGVLCHEHIGHKRSWTNDERSFAIAISSLVALALERCERQRAQSALALQSAALNAVPHATLITDPNAAIVWVNPAFTALFGYTEDEAKGRNLIELLKSGQHGSSFIDEIWSELNSGRVWQGEICNRRKDGRVVIVDQTVTPVKDAHGQITHLVVVKVDLTAKRSLEEQVLQAQKMEIVGRLSGGIAHDFNNLLTVINGSAEMALLEMPAEHPLRVDFERIQESGKRATALTRQLLAFSRKHITNRSPICISTVVKGFSSMLQRLIGEDILLDVSGDPLAGSVLADESQIEQVILNLAINSRDAMPRGGVLRIGVDRVELDAKFVAAHRGSQPGPHVRITVTDTGEGMSAAVLEKIFEPFFTTKEQGKGTGLGLATVFAVVEQSGGTISVSSAVGVGTTFTIYLPRVEDVVTAAESIGSAAAERASARIMVVEDDAGVRELAVRILTSVGYTVIAAEDGASALRLVGSPAEKFDLIVTDVVLPDMGGRDLASRVALLRPGLPVLFTSGYTNDVVLSRGVHDNTAQFISKPYSAPALRRKVREMLRQAGAKSGGRA